jgi:hypothetical protein
MGGLHLGESVPELNPRSLLAGPQRISLPLDFVTESSAILAKKGSGKTNALIVLLEEVAAAGVPVVSVDPKGDHWGLKAGSEGNPNAGLPIVVFGGLHHDVPLEPTGGALVADLIRDRGLSAVLDVSEFTIGERARFLTAFADRLYRFDSHEPMLLGLEEAHEYIPQMVRGEEARMVGAFERLVKLGRSKGLGVVMVTQRSASLNKNVLTQVDNLFVMRTTSPQDRAAVTAWLDTNADRSVLDNLGGLQTGETVLVQPARGEPLRFQFRMRRTFDAGETPKVGEKRREPATIADVDLVAIAAAMADTIERSKADDPKVLRATIADLQRQLAARPVEEVVREVEKVVEVPLLSDDDRLVLAEIDGMLRGLASVLPLHTGILEKIDAASTREAAPPARAQVPRQVPQVATPANSPGLTPPADSAVDEVRPPRLEWPDRDLSPTERGILTVLAQFPKPLGAKQITARGGPSWKSSTFQAALPALRRAGLLAPGSSAALVITDTGRSVVGPVEEPPTGRALLTWWQSRLSPTEHGVLRALVDAWPGSLTSAEVAERSGYSPRASTFQAAIPTLRKQELISGTNGALRADDVFGEN